MTTVIIGAYSDEYSRHPRLVDLLRELQDHKTNLPHLIYDHKGMFFLYYDEPQHNKFLHDIVTNGYITSDGDSVTVEVTLDTELPRGRDIDGFLDVAEYREGKWYTGTGLLYLPCAPVREDTVEVYDDPRDEDIELEVVVV